MILIEAAMRDEHHEASRYRFWRWLIELALKHRQIYWLLWGILAVIAICAWRFGLNGFTFLL